MVLNKYLLVGLLAVNSICLAGGVYAAVVPEAEPAAHVQQVPDQLQSIAGAKRDDQQDKQTAANTAETEQNKEAIKDLTALTGNQNFVLQILAVLVPFLSLIATGFIGLAQLRAKQDRHAMAEETRSNLSHMGRSINGMKDELVAAVKASAFAEGVAHGVSVGANPDAASQLQERSAQLAKEAEHASAKATQIANEAIKKIEEKPANAP